jgi:hypothetical protein
MVDACHQAGSSDMRDLGGGEKPDIACVKQAVRAQLQVCTHSAYVFLVIPELTVCSGSLRANGMLLPDVVPSVDQLFSVSPSGRPLRF